MDAASQLGYCGIEPLRRTFSANKPSLHLSITTRRRRNRLDVRAVATEPKPSGTKTTGGGSSASPSSTKPINGSSNFALPKTINGSSTRMETVSQEIKRVRAQMEENEDLAILMRGLRGQNLSDSQFADDTVKLRLVEAVTAVSDILDGSLSPFYKLKYVKLPPEYTESSISACLKSYLLGRCPKATIVTTLPQKDLIPPSEGASVTAQPVELRGPLAAPTEVAVDSGNIPKSVPIDTVGVQEEHVVHNSVIHAEGTSNDPVISFKGNRDFGLWQGHEVKSEFVCLLDLIIGKYPETFKDFAAKSKKFCTMKLNMLCTSINDFTKISLAEVNAEMVVEYRNVFADLQDLGFNLSWLVSRLNHIEQLCLSQPLIPQLHAIECQIDETKKKLVDLQTLCAEKMQEIQKAFGIKGTNLAAVNIGDNLFSGP